MDLENEQEVFSCQGYVYLDVTFNNTETGMKEIEKPVVKVKNIIRDLNSIFWSKKIIERRKFNICETKVLFYMEI